MTENGAETRGVEPIDAETRGMEPIEKDRKAWRRWLLFVLFAILLWYVFSLLVMVVTSCLPGGTTCVLTDFSGYTSANDPWVRGWWVLTLTLLTALWISGRACFPPEKE